LDFEFFESSMGNTTVLDDNIGHTSASSVTDFHHFRSSSKTTATDHLIKE
jgi:hypothetical protein